MNNTDLDVTVATNKLNILINVWENTNNKKSKIYIVREILKCIDKYSNIFFNDIKYQNLIDILENKLHEFKKEEKLKNKCNKLLQKYYGHIWTENRCNAYTLKHLRCKNITFTCDKSKSKDISKNYYCTIHYTKYDIIFELLIKYILPDIATKCIHIFL
jgi:hypothetical protein